MPLCAWPAACHLQITLFLFPWAPSSGRIETLPLKGAEVKVPGGHVKMFYNKTWMCTSGPIQIMTHQLGSGHTVGDTRTHHAYFPARGSFSLAGCSFVGPRVQMRVWASSARAWLSRWFRPRPLVSRDKTSVAWSLPRAQQIQFAAINCSLTRFHPMRTRDVEPMLVYCLSSVVDNGPTLNQHCLNVSCDN